MDCNMSGFPVLHYLPEFDQIMSTKLVILSNHLILCHPLFFLPSIFLSTRVFSSESALRIKWPKYWSFSFSICPSNEYSGLISFRIDWFDLLTNQGTLKSLLQQHNLKASTLWDPIDCSTPGLPVPHHLLKFAQVHVHCIGDAIQPSHPLSPSSLPVLNLSQHLGLFQWSSYLHQAAKVWSFSFSISPSKEYSGLISFKIYWFDLPAVQETLKSLL